MKKIFSIFFIIIIIFQSVGVISLLKIQQTYIKNTVKSRIKSGIPAAEHLLFTFHKNDIADNSDDLQFIHSKEFRYKGEMYDVLNKVEKADSVVYTVIHDPKETGLFAKLDKYVNDDLENNPFQKQLTRNIKNLLFAVYLLVSYEELQTTYNLFSVYNYYNNHEITRYLRPNSPPPELV